LKRHFGKQLLAAMRLFCLEHLLYALTFDEQIAEILRSAGADISTLRRDLENFFDKHIEVVPLKSPRSAATEPAQTPAVQRVLQRAIMHVRSAHERRDNASRSSHCPLF